MNVFDNGHQYYLAHLVYEPLHVLQRKGVKIKCIKLKHCYTNPSGLLRWMGYVAAADDDQTMVITMSYQAYKITAALPVILPDYYGLI